VKDASGTEWYIATPLGAELQPEGLRTFATLSVSEGIGTVD
jgi:hypothetical protein